MKDRLKKSITYMMLVLLVFMLMVPVTVQADSVDENINTDETMATVEDSMTYISENSEEGIKYIYVDKGNVDFGESQSIVVSFFDGELEISNAEITGVLSDGTEFIVSNGEKVNSAFLFEKAFEMYDETLCEITSVKYTVAGIENVVSLSELGLNPIFTINRYVEENVAVINDDTLEGNIETLEASIETLMASTPSTLANSDGNVVIVIDPGHDILAPGAQVNGLSEEKCVLKIAKYCRDELLKYEGVEVYLTRESEKCPMGQTDGSHNETQCLQWRADFAKEKNADLFLSFHLNSFTNSKAHGVEVWHPTENWKPEIGKTGKAAAEIICDELASLGLYNRGPKCQSASDEYPDGSKEDNFAICRMSKYNDIPGLIVEHAFMTNDNNADKFLRTESGLQSLGVADANAVVKFFGLSKGDGIASDNGWKESDGYRYYFRNGTAVTGWEPINGTVYRFDSKGRQMTGWQTLKGKRYYYHSNGRPASGWELIDGKAYRFDSKGCQLLGWQSFKTSRYYYNSNGRAVTGWELIDGGVYRFNSKGVQMTGWQSLKGNKYFYMSNGKPATGWETINGKPYRFNSKGCQLLGWQAFKTDRYYFKSNGQAATGWEPLNGEIYRFDSKGRQMKNWQTLKGKRYFYDYRGYLQDGWTRIDGYNYYFKNDGRAVTGWESIDGVVYRFDSMGRQLLGTQTLNGKQYNYDSEGRLLDNGKPIPKPEVKPVPEPESDSEPAVQLRPESECYVIAGKSDITAEDLVAYHKKYSRSYEYPAEALEKGGAADIETFAKIVYEESVSENIKPEVVFVQAMLETKWLQFGGDVKIEQFNFAGIGATGNGVAGEAYEDVRTGIRAQVQHLKAYASKDPLQNTCVDSRFTFVTRGTAKYVEWLGINENPNRKGWASSRMYGYILVDMINNLKAVK